MENQTFSKSNKNNSSGSSGEKFIDPSVYNFYGKKFKNSEFNVIIKEDTQTDDDKKYLQKMNFIYNVSLLITFSLKT